MESIGIAKYTKLLPLSIRKEISSSGNVFGQSQNCGVAPSGGFGREQGGASEFFRDPFDNIGANFSPTTTSTTNPEQREVVRVTVTYPSPSAGALNPHKEISLRLTNDENPTFFYHLRISEADYPAIKSQQGLLVDFYGFPNQLITLLDKCDPSCLADEEDKGLMMSGSPKFILVMKIGINSVLDIVESNPFKYLCHLSMIINPGTDTEVKKYLADVTSGLKKDCSLLNEKYSHLASTMEAEIIRLKKLLDQKNEELQQTREEMHSQASSLSQRHFQDLTGEKEKLLKLQSDLASKFESDRNETERRHAQAIGSLEMRIGSLEGENRELVQTKFKNETTLQSYSTKIKTLDDDLKILQQELTLARKKNEKLDSDYHEKQRIVNSHQNRLSVLESDLKEKQIALQRQQDFIDKVSEQKKFIEDHASNMVKEVDKLRGVNKNISAELIKANEIIRKFQDDIRSLHAKTKLQNQITLEQERRINDMAKQLQQFDESTSKLQTQLSAAEESESHAKHELEESIEKIESLENTIKSNENMITWLNKQLNEFQGLGKLTKFRQNLANATTGSVNGETLYGRSNAQESFGPGNISTAAVNGSGRVGAGALFSSNFQNTLPNGTPSWMHIYQSTSTPLDNDNELSSRFERISASNNNFSLGRSRLDAISESSGNNNPVERNSANSNSKVPDENQDPGNEGQMKKTAVAGKTFTGSNKPGAVKAPTWAKPRSGKVTLQSTGAASVQGKFSSTWRNA